MQEYLGNTAEAERLRTIAKDKMDQRIAAAKGTGPGQVESWWQCEGCAAVIDNVAEPCGKCGGISFEKITQPKREAVK